MMTREISADQGGIDTAAADGNRGRYNDGINNRPAEQKRM